MGTGGSKIDCTCPLGAVVNSVTIGLDDLGADLLDAFNVSDGFDGGSMGSDTGLD